MDNKVECEDCEPAETESLVNVKSNGNEADDCRIAQHSDGKSVDTELSVKAERNDNEIGSNSLEGGSVYKCVQTQLPMKTESNDDKSTDGYEVVETAVYPLIPQRDRYIPQNEESSTLPAVNSGFVERFLKELFPDSLSGDLLVLAVKTGIELVRFLKGFTPYFNKIGNIAASTSSKIADRTTTYIKEYGENMGAELVKSVQQRLLHLFKRANVGAVKAIVALFMKLFFSS